MKRVLILGGTQFMGRMLTEQLLESKKYELTLFNRGKTNPDLFPEARKLVGDRETDDIRKLFDADWDIVVDFSAYHPDSFERMLNGMAGRIGRYVFLSTVSVYQPLPEVLKDENAALLPCTEDQRKAKVITPENYGAKKADMDRFLLSNAQLDSIILRPCLVYGPYDHTDRFYYWMYRVFSQDRFLLPEEDKDLMNLTYVRDMVSIIRKAMEIKAHRQIYNTTTHPPNTLEEKVSVIQQVMQKDNEWIRLPGDEIAEKLGRTPVWTGNSQYIFNHSKVVKDFELDFMSFEDSIKDYYKFLVRQGSWEEGSVGPRIEEERAWIKEILS